MLRTHPTTFRKHCGCMGRSISLMQSGSPFQSTPANTIHTINLENWTGGKHYPSPPSLLTMHFIRFLSRAEYRGWRRRTEVVKEKDVKSKEKGARCKRREPTQKDALRMGMDWGFPR